MELNNYSFNVYEKINKDERVNWQLYIDAIYKSDPAKKDMSAEVLSKLLGVKNQGGFRYLGKETVGPHSFTSHTLTSDDNITYWYTCSCPDCEGKKYNERTIHSFFL